MKVITKCSGGYVGDGHFLDEIVEFSPTSEEWTVLEDNMMKARAGHAVSVISSDDAQQFCIN